MRRCVVGNGLVRCTLDEGHGGRHHTLFGAGAVSWAAPSPEWIGSLTDGHYAHPGEPEYDVALERMREICSAYAIVGRRQGDRP